MKIEWLVLSIATNQFTVPLPTGKEVVRAVNSYSALVAALEGLHRDELPDGLCWCDFDVGGGEFIPEGFHQDECLSAKKALSLARGEETKSALRGALPDATPDAGN